jgi:hypothetical protein
MNKLTVVCVKVGTKYKPNYVIKLKSMVARNLEQPHDFVCFTDDPKGLDGIDWYKLPDTTLEGWWSKINLFRADLPFSGPMLYLDLDVIVTGSLDQMIDSVPEDIDFAIIRQWKKKIKKVTRYGYTRAAYNSSMMFWRHVGCRKEIVEKLTPQGIAHWRGDQDWIAVCRPYEFTFNDKFVCGYEDLGPAGPGRRPDVKLVLFSKLENHYIAPKVDWVRNLWK